MNDVKRQIQIQMEVQIEIEILELLVVYYSYKVVTHNDNVNNSHHCKS